jgi:hypothetical protein
LVCGNVIGVGAIHALENRFVDGREHRIRKWIAWVGRLADRGEEGVVSLLYITLWVFPSGHGRTVVTIKVARSHCCG